MKNMASTHTGNDERKVGQGGQWFAALSEVLYETILVVGSATLVGVGTGSFAIAGATLFALMYLGRKIEAVGTANRAGPERTQ